MEVQGARTLARAGMASSNELLGVVLEARAVRGQACAETSCSNESHYASPERLVWGRLGGHSATGTQRSRARGCMDGSMNPEAHIRQAPRPQVHKGCNAAVFHGASMGRRPEQRHVLNPNLMFGKPQVAAAPEARDTKGLHSSSV